MKLHMKIFLLTLIIVLILAGTVFADPVTTNEIYHESADFKYVQKNTIYQNSGYFYMRKIDYNVSGKVYQTSFYIPGTTGTVRYSVDNKEMIEAPLSDGLLPSDVMIHIQTDQYNMILGQGYTYRDLGNGTIESISSKAIQVKRQNEKWLITYNYDMQEGCFGILWGVGSHKELMDYTNENQRKLWSGYDLNKHARLSYEGYYYKSPSSYMPYSENAYWRIPSSYITNSLVGTGGSLAADIMSNALLLTAKDTLNEEGYIPSQPLSNWLAHDYNIGAGFFDTRFNADTMKAFIIGYQKYKNPLFRETYLKMADYYMKHADNKHFSNINAAGIEGWLVEDYADKDNKETQTHVSLNHQLQAIHVFLMLYEEENNQKYLDYADKMLYGIKNSADKWIMEDNNLEYAYLINGEMGLIDYPFLTYNDLYVVQLKLMKIKGERDPELELLMAAKKAWMDANHISGYIKE
jgi:hypothetical protein